LNTDMTHEARRYCHGDDAWTDWQTCTAEQAAEYKARPDFEVRATLRHAVGVLLHRDARARAAACRQRDPARVCV
jgi:hypothetical protein